MRHSLACITSLVLASLALSGCTLSTSDPGDDPEDLTEVAQPLLTTTTMASYSPSPLEVTNGKRAVIAGGVLHVVYASGGAVRYISSTDGVNFSAPVTIDSSAAQNPTIAVANDGTVVVAFVRNAVSGIGTIHLARRPPGGNFAPAFSLTIPGNTDDDSSNSPSLVANGNTFYLTWVKGAIFVKYASFPSSQSSSLSSVEGVNAASGNHVYHPTVMVGPGASGPVIRVAFFDNVTTIPVLQFWVMERGASSFTTAYLNSWAYSSSATAVSMSSDVNPVTGDAYIASSEVVDGVGITGIWRENTLTPGNNFAYDEILPNTAALVSVAARTESCQSRFRIVTSTPYGGHGAASYRTGTWTSAAAPTWLEATQSLPGVGRASTALLQSIAIPNSSSTRFFRGTYEVSSAGTFQLADAYDTGTTPEPCE